MAPNDYDDFDDDDDLEEEEEEVEVAVAPKRRAKKWKDPTKPKRAMSAFFLFSQANRPRVKEENPDISFGEVARMLAQEYKQLSEEDMKEWKAKAEEEKERYKSEMEDYVPMEDPTGGGRKKQKKDPNAPKRNMSAYFLYSVHIRPSVKEQNPEASFGDVARIISAQFKELTEEEKAVWAEKAAADKERYQREMAEYQG
mmetsp:Transcript_16566/g.45519  ORF Transcript_16566/g.45519 Transcript_16566/m.45519 type:complete len:199 (+) Transcript_16566:107-703(+)